MTSQDNLRIAILSDFHGNSIALEAVLNDIQAQGGTDQYWMLGDYAAIGYDPVNVLKRLAALPQAHFIRGNTDRYIVSGERPGPSAERVQRDPALMETLVHVASSFSWTTGALSVTGWLPWLAELPLELRTNLPDGTRVLAVHAAPGTDDGHGIHPGRSDDELRRLLSTAEADLVLVGHTHAPFDRMVDGLRVVNPGSVSNPFPPDLRACYALLSASSTGYQVDLRRVNYNREAVIEATRQAAHPAAPYITRHMRGEVEPPWK